MNKTVFLYKAVLSVFLFSLCFSFSAQAQTVKYAKSSITTTAQFFAYEYLEFGGKTYKDIKYFLVLDSKGDVKAGFDACDVCYRSFKGYSQVDKKMQCNNCGNKYDIDLLGTAGSGGCWPGHLVYTVEGDSISFKASDIEAGEYFFQSVKLSVKKVVSTTKFTLVQKDNLLIVNSDNEETYTVTIIGLNGTVIYFDQSWAKEAQLDVSSLTTGIYVVYTQSNSANWAKRFMIF